jgi:hypothetical protein
MDDNFSFSSLHVDATRDSDKTYSYAAGIDWLMMPDLRLNLTGVKTSNSSIGDDADVRQYIIGFSNDILNTTTVGFDFSSTEYGSGIRTRSLQGLLAFNGANWSLSLTPSLSPTEIDAERLVDKVELTSTGLVTRLSYFSDQSWSGSLSYGRYEYSKEFTGLRSGDDRLSLISAAAPGFVRGLEKSFIGASASYRSGADGAILDYFRSRNYLTSALTRRYTLTYTYDFASALSSKISVAKQITENRDDLFIYGLSLVYSW